MPISIRILRYINIIAHILFYKRIAVTKIKFHLQCNYIVFATQLVNSFNTIKRQSVHWERFHIRFVKSKGIHFDVTEV